MSLIPSFYMKSTVSIGVGDSLNPSWIGTGFIVKKMITNKQCLIFLVTNKHVLGDNEKIYIRLKEVNSDEIKIIPLDLIVDGEKRYTKHPKPDIDIAVVSLNGPELVKQNLELAAFDIDENAMSSTEFLENGGAEGTFVYMLGYPMGLVNTYSNAPICRTGCVARIDPKEIASKKTIILDIQNFPGNSGSPVINKPEITGIEGTLPLNRSSLIGIVCSYIPYEEPLYNLQTKQIEEIRRENSGLANVHPVEYIRETLELEMQRYMIEFPGSKDSKTKEEGVSTNGT